MNFRFAKSESKIRHLRLMGSEICVRPGDLGSGRRAGRGAEEAFGVCRNANFNLTRLLPPLCETGPADPNAPSGASTAGPVLVNWRLGAVDCVLQSAASGSTF